MPCHPFGLPAPALCPAGPASDDWALGCCDVIPGDDLVRVCCTGDATATGRASGAFVGAAELGAGFCPAGGAEPDGLKVGRAWLAPGLAVGVPTATLLLVCCAGVGVPAGACGPGGALGSPGTGAAAAAVGAAAAAALRDVSSQSSSPSSSSPSGVKKSGAEDSRRVSHSTPAQHADI